MDFAIFGVFIDVYNYCVLGVRRVHFRSFWFCGCVLVVDMLDGSLKGGIRGGLNRCGICWMIKLGMRVEDAFERGGVEVLSGLRNVNIGSDTAPMD